MATVHIAGIDLGEVAQGYIDAALWADCMPDCDCEPGSCGCESGGLTDLTVSDEDRAAIERHVAAFVQVNYADCRAYMRLLGDWTGPTDSLGRDSYSAAERLGHDLRMTSGGHGVGFWDRGLPEDLGKRLSDACDLGTPFCTMGGGDVWQDGDTARFDIRD